MNLERVPLVSQVLASGTNDRVFDALLLAGPPVIVSLALLGRSLPTLAIAAAYLATFVGHVLGNALRG